MVDKEEKWHHPNPLQAVHIAMHAVMVLIEYCSR